jgi:tRNA-(ms[2]io[6]A)-hydroxylase
MDGKNTLETLPLRSATPPVWADLVLREPVRLLADHAHLERKAAINAIYLVSHWPQHEGMVEGMQKVATEELEHLGVVHRILVARGGRLTSEHSNPYVAALQKTVRKGTVHHLLDRLLVAGLIEARSCERFEVLASRAEDRELRKLYSGLCSSERGHYRLFVGLAERIFGKEVTEARWEWLLDREDEILAELPFTYTMHGGTEAPEEHGGEAAGERG